MTVEMNDLLFARNFTSDVGVHAAEARPVQREQPISPGSRSVSNSTGHAHEMDGTAEYARRTRRARSYFGRPGIDQRPTVSINVGFGPDIPIFPNVAVMSRVTCGEKTCDRTGRVDRALHVRRLCGDSDYSGKQI